MKDIANVMDLVHDISKGRFYQWGELVTVLESMQRDAARYRWLRDSTADTPGVVTDYGWCEELDWAKGVELDAAIDEAMVKP